jgi:hypothetical protein
VEEVPSAQEVADLKVRLTRQAALIEQLRTPVVPDDEAPTAKSEFAAPAGNSLLCPGQNLRWLRRDALTLGTVDEDAEQWAILLHNLRAMGRRDIAIESVLGNHSGQYLSQRLAATFREASWNVHASPTAPKPKRVHGLILAAGQCPLPLAATATYMALKAAGFHITPRLDSALGTAEAILIVGSAGESAS